MDWLDGYIDTEQEALRIRCFHIYRHGFNHHAYRTIPYSDTSKRAEIFSCQQWYRLFCTQIPMRMQDRLIALRSVGVQERTREQVYSILHAGLMEACTRSNAGKKIALLGWRYHSLLHLWCGILSIVPSLPFSNSYIVWYKKQSIEIVFMHFLLHRMRGLVIGSGTLAARKEVWPIPSTSQRRIKPRFVYITRWSVSPETV